MTRIQGTQRNKRNRPAQTGTDRNRQEQTGTDRNGQTKADLVRDWSRNDSNARNMFGLSTSHKTNNSHRKKANHTGFQASWAGTNPPS